MYKKTASIVLSLVISGLLITGCRMPSMTSQVSKVKNIFTKPLSGSEGSAEAAKDEPDYLAKYPEKDSVVPEAKRQMGIHYDPAVFEQGAYRPDELKNMLSSKGFDGIVQQTYAEAGGDFDVDIDRNGELMAFSTTRYSKNPDICIQSVKGRAVTLHTSDPASDMMPKFSSDAKQVAWCSNRYGNWDIMVSPSNRSPRMRPQQLTSSTDDEVHPTWSPDGKLLAFSRYSAMDGLWRIWVLDLTTRSLSSVTEGLFPEFKPVVDQGPDGKPQYKLLYQKHRKRDIPWYSVWTIGVTMNADGQIEVANSPTEIVANDKWAAINPTWSPEGRYIAFASVRKSAASQWQARIYKADDVWVVNVNGTDLTQITSHTSPDWSPCWATDKNSPSGRLYFNSLRSGHENVWSVKPVIAGMIAQSSMFQ
ncbi:MAG: TolB family protein [Planctomycetota bacterium]|jgi:dipeptidyl aminopeptidase/acylaminoacyl peptidase